MYVCMYVCMYVLFQKKESLKTKVYSSSGSSGNVLLVAVVRCSVASANRLGPIRQDQCCEEWQSTEWPLWLRGSCSYWKPCGRTVCGQYGIDLVNPPIHVRDNEVF